VRLVSGCLAQADLATAGSACDRFSGHLTRRLGRRRAQALLLLGLALARAECPLLDEVEVGLDGQLTPLDKALARQPEHAQAAAVALLTHTLHLLATLEGDPAAAEAARALSAFSES
jgi:ABC-type transport system involved in cytochrome bd biosynthesis fused ATPase/permease subunit